MKGIRPKRYQYKPEARLALGYGSEDVEERGFIREDIPKRYYQGENMILRSEVERDLLYMLVEERRVHQ